MELRAVRVCQRVPAVASVRLIFCNIMSEICQDRCVETLDLAESLGVISSHGQVFSAQTDSDCREDLEQELQFIVRQQISRNTVRFDAIIHKNSRSIRRGYRGDR